MNPNKMPNPLPEEKRMLLAGYVLGDLVPEERERVEQLVLDDPVMLKELQALQASFEVMPQGLVPVVPPAHLRERIVMRSSKAVGVREPREPEVRQSRGKIWPVLVGVVAISTLALAMDNLRLRNQLAQRIKSDRVASILQQPNSRLIALTGDGNDAAGTLLFTPGNWQEVIVSLGDLPPLPPEEIYRMWLMLENGTVIYCGEFNTQNDGSVFVRFTPDETPPKGVKATQLLVTIDGSQTEPDPSREPVMTGAI
ncbi:anti-sigma factor [Leptothoe spongobia]|uniref:Anti-sigma factor n=1 Tax=Leptothoe spongobia TAU-MAC 1115 TaxID=1967444 RepID=A0A947DIH2_9CYAN|nr:anti-sigma factor [Leptothoe spongobia]MBT9317633.1 anti-sigma factor [Leptothoe spongobia TAU-MAC 1115]